MDPETLRTVQILLAEIFGMFLAVVGIWLFVRGVTGMFDIAMSAPGISAKLTNASPGVIVFVIGCAIFTVALLWPSYERTETREESANPADVLNEWLARVPFVAADDGYLATTNKIWGEVEEGELVVRSDAITLSEPVTLEALAVRELGDGKYWPLIAVANKDKGIFAYEEAHAGTYLTAGSVVEVWRPSRFYNMSIDERWRVAGPMKEAAYEDILNMVESGFPWGDAAFSEIESRHPDLELVLSVAEKGGAETLRELAMKYYGDAKFWPIIRWTNPDAFGEAVKDTAPLPDQILMVVHFIP